MNGNSGRQQLDAASTLRIWVGFFMVMLCFYFVLSWTPRLLVAAGMSTQQGITGGVLLNIGGIVGGTVFAWLSVRGSLKTLSAISLLLAAAALAAYGYVSGHLSSAFVLALLSGMLWLQQVSIVLAEPTCRLKSVGGKKCSLSPFPPVANPPTNVRNPVELREKAYT